MPLYFLLLRKLFLKFLLYKEKAAHSLPEILIMKDFILSVSQMHAKFVLTIFVHYHTFSIINLFYFSCAFPPFAVRRSWVSVPAESFVSVSVLASLV
jgi:hypothetical protein